MTVTQMVWGPAAVGAINSISSALTATNLNDSDNAAGWVFNVPKDGTITDIGFYVVTETGTSPAYNGGLVTVDSSGRPTTSAYGGSAITSHQHTTTGWKWVTLSTPATAAAGDWAAVHIYPGGSTPDGSNFIAVATQAVHLAMGNTLGFTTSWSVTNPGTGLFAVKYSDSSIYGNAVTTNTAHAIVRQNTTPDEVGCKFTLPGAMTCRGAVLTHVFAAIGSAATYDVVLYDASNNVLATAAVGDKDYIDEQQYFSVHWDAVNLTAGTTYRLIIKPGVAANGDIYVPKWAYESTAARSWLPAGDDWQWTERTDAGSWSDTDSLTWMGLIVSDISFASGTMTRTISRFFPQGAAFPTSNFPQRTVVRDSQVLGFDATTAESCIWTDTAPQGLTTPLNAVIYYTMASATTGGVAFTIEMEASAPGDAFDTDAGDSFDSVNTGTDATVPGTAGYPDSVSITLSNNDSVAEGDRVRYRLTRAVSNGSDTATGDCYVWMVEIKDAGA